MQLDEMQAYALAAWHRFDQEVTDDLLRAVAGSFALIACADGDLAQSEVDAFVRAVIEGDGIPKLDATRLDAIFRDISQSMLTDVEGGRERALQAVQKLAADPDRARLVAHAAHFAMLADGRVRHQEREALQKVCDALGVDVASLQPG